jgi:hypothetical protein
MKKTFLRKRFTYSIICLMLLLNSSSFAQRVLSDDELIDSAFNAYRQYKWVMASVYLFAYIQKNPADISSNSDYANEVAKACAYSFKSLGYEGGTTMALPDVGGVAGNDELRSNANNAIQSGNYASACIYIFAYFQKAGTPGETVDENIYSNYNRCKNQVYLAISNKQNVDVQQADNGDDNAQITNGLGEKPPPLFKPAQFVQPHVLTDAPMSFSGFPDAFAAVLHLYENDFSNYQGGPVGNGLPNDFLTKITIADAGVKAENIYMKNNNWSFRFVIEGNASDESSEFNMEKQTIETALANLGRSYTTTVKPYQQGSVLLNSVEYRSNDVSVTIWPAIFGDRFSDNVIITHLH